MLGLRRTPSCLLLAIPLLLAAESASAIVTVGPIGSGCKYTSIQSAINEVLDKERTAAPDVDPYIAVAGNNLYREVLFVNSTGVRNYQVLGQGPVLQYAFVQIYGNYDQHCDDIPDGSTAIVNASTIDNHPLLQIQGSSAVSVVLNHLVLEGANHDSGIYWSGSSGSLELSNVEIRNNHALDGGGIVASSELPGASIILHSGTWIHDNSATNVGGGGIFVGGQTRLFALEPQTLIEYNHVSSSTGAARTGMGGGILVYGPAIADIGSPGYNGAPVVSNNTAIDGGGIAAEGGGVVRLFASNASLPARIEYNTATRNGGGIFADDRDKVCGDGYSISHNEAAHGAAVYADNSSFVDLTAQALIECNTSNASLPPRADCPACNTISGNVGAVGGSAIELGSGLATIVSPLSRFSAERVLFDRNTGYTLVESPGPVSLANCLVTNNTAAHNLVEIFGSTLTIDSCTVTQNSVAAGGVAFSATGDVFLRRSIIWQAPALTLPFSGSHAKDHLTDLVTNDASTLNSSSGFSELSNVNFYDPEFVDAANGNFRLTPESPAVDYAASGLATDVTSQGRPVRLLRTNTPYDIGAYESQNLGDVIFPGGFER